MQIINYSYFKFILSYLDRNNIPTIENMNGL
jgi:hypothetical protein